MQIVFDFIAGEISFDEFWSEYCSDSKIGEWIDNAADFKNEPPSVISKDNNLITLYRAISSVYDGHVLKMLEKSPYPPHNPYETLVRSQCGIYDMIQTAVLTKYPNIKRTKRYKEDDDYYYKALGRSVGGSEVMTYAEEVLNRIPRSMKKSARIVAGKEAVRKAFHIKDKKFPHWAQEPEWPMGKNSPMEYIGQHREGELVALRFRDVDTGEERVVEQFY